MTKSARVLAAALGITLLGTLPALGGPRIKPHIPLPAPSSASSSSGPAAARQQSAASRTFKDGLVSDIAFPSADGAAKSAGSSASWSSASRHP